MFIKRYWRQGLVLGVALATMAIASPSASAFCVVQPTGLNSGCGTTPVYATSQPSFKGMAHVVNPSGTSSRVQAYYWYDNKWNSYSLVAGSEAYVEKYASGWDWAYSYSLQYWFVVPTNHIVIRESGSCPPGQLCPQ